MNRYDTTSKNNSSERDLILRITKRMKYEMDQMPIHVEGKGNATWVLVDYFDIVVHVFYPETRRFYEIEQLWSDAVTTEYQNILS